jgi:lipopolysaccharide/colanic/teichoic acid biosynthesis glycosyltransferase
MASAQRMGIAMSGLQESQPAVPRARPRVSAPEPAPAGARGAAPALPPLAMPAPTVQAQAAPFVPAVTVAASSNAARRTVNFVLALVGLIVALPLMLLVAILIKLTSRGPVMYTQVRVGLDRRNDDPSDTNHRRQADIGGKPFDIYKFRTMHVDAERNGTAVWAQKHDPRVTWIGRYLRQYRIDELPQLLNVLKGEMNIVGPRPERPMIFAELRENIAEYPLRQRAKPGITGLAQINHHYDSCLDDVRKKVSYDLEYISRQSVWEDVRIMLQTVPVILFRRGGW